MTKKFTIMYEINDETQCVEWYARTKENAEALFKMWHPEVKIIEIK